MKALIEKLERDFEVSEVAEQKPGLTFCKVDREMAETLIRELRDREGFTHLAFLTAVDYIEKGIFTLTYMLHNYDTKASIGLHVDLERENASMTSIHRLWGQAATYQRELREMFGIRFPGSPRLDDDFCLEGWDEIPPMRREFDTLKYSEETFGNRDGRASEEPRERMHEVMFPTRGGDR